MPLSVYIATLQHFDYYSRGQTVLFHTFRTQ